MHGTRRTAYRCVDLWQCLRHEDEGRDAGALPQPRLMAGARRTLLKHQAVSENLLHGQHAAGHQHCSAHRNLPGKLSCVRRAEPQEVDQQLSTVAGRWMMCECTFISTRQRYWVALGHSAPKCCSLSAFLAAACTQEVWQQSLAASAAVGRPVHCSASDAHPLSSLLL